MRSGERTPIKTARRVGAAMLVAAGLIGAVPHAGHAITDGRADGNGHPNVGIIAFYTPEGRFRCTATLISPTVVVTAAHCTVATIGKTIVSFDSNIALAPPSPIPTADPATGYTGAPGTVAGVTWYAGQSYTAPNYSNFTDVKNWNDYAVVVLDAPVSIAPAQLAPVNYTNAFAQPSLNKTLFTAVGYGTEVRKPDTGPQKPQPMSYPLYRRVAEEPGQKLTPQIIQTNGNGNDPRGTGGTCFGDSGGPLFLNGYLVAVTSYGYTSNCRYLDGFQRVDMASSNSWITGFIAP